MYGAKFQQANPLDTSPPLDKAEKKFIQEVTGVFLYLAGAVDSTMLTALSSLASKQAAPTEMTMQKCLQFLDYAASQEDSIVTYQASNTSSQYTAMHCTYLNPRPAAEPAATCSWQAWRTSPSTMEQYSIFCK
jgi:hypothetical protein